MGRKLYLYLTTSDEAISSVLVREENKVQMSVYHVSKVFKDIELGYKQIKKMAYEVIISARKLRS